MNLKKYSIGLAIIILALVLPLVVFAQDTSPTEIPVLPETTQESAAPQAPDVAPPNVSSDASQALVPEATEAVETATETTIAETVCPVAVQDSFTATEILCEGLTSGEACVGNGVVDALFGADVSGLSFSEPADRVRLTSLDELSLNSSSGFWSVVSARIELITTGGSIAPAPMLVFGDVTIVDTGQTSATGAQNATVIAQSGMNVRRAPGAEGVIVWQLQPGEEVLSTGITADRQWIRIIIPNEYQGTGWVYAPYLDVEGGVEILPYVNEFSPPADLTPPEFGAMQSIELLSGKAQTDCGTDIPDSGILLQSPNGTPDSLRFKVNGVEIQLNGTAFIQAQAGGNLTVSILEGQATISSTSASAGDSVVIALDNNLAASGSPNIESFDPAIVDILPVRLLPRQFAFGVVSTDDTTESSSQSFGTAPSTTPAEDCTLTASESVRNIRSGPSTEYETVKVLQPNESVIGIGQALGELNLTWYQTDEFGWVRIDTISASSSCSSLPVVDAPPPPTVVADEFEEGAVGLSSSQLGNLVCDGSQITGTVTSDGSDVSVSIGGTWTAAGGATVNFTTGGGQLRPEVGSYIQLVAEDGTMLASSGEGLTLQVTFEQSTTFSTRFSAGNGDVVSMAVTCGSSAPVAPQAPAVPTGGTGLTSSELGEVTCDGTQVAGSTTSDGTDVTVAIGGLWTVKAGRTILFTATGGQLRPEAGSYIQLVTKDGTVLASSGEGLSMQVLFEQDVSFYTRLSAGNGDLVNIAASCQ